MYLRSYILQHGTRPSFQAMCDAVGWKSKRSVQLFLQRQAVAGFLEYKDGEIKLLGASDAETAQRFRELADISKTLTKIRTETASALLKLSRELASVAQQLSKQE